MSAQVTEELRNGETPEHGRTGVATAGPAMHVDQHASAAAMQLPHPQAQLGQENLCVGALQRDSGGAGCAPRRLPGRTAEQPQAVSPQRTQQQACPATHTAAADSSMSEPAGMPIPNSSPTERRPAGAGPEAMPRSQAESGGRDGDADEVLSQKPLAEIRQQMLASQPRRTQQRRYSATPRPDSQPPRQHVDCGLPDEADGGLAQLSQVPLAVRASSQLAPIACGEQQLPQRHTQRLQTGVDAQLSQLPLSSRAAVTQRGDGLATGLAGTEDVQLSQIPLAKWATSAPREGSSQARRAEVQKRSRSGAGAPAVDAAARSTADRAQQRSVQDAAPADAIAALPSRTQGQSQPWSASAAHLRKLQQQQQTPPPRWSDPCDQENDPLEDLTLHQRQWVASSQHRAVGFNSSRLTATAAPTAATKPEAAELPGPRAEHRTPGTCPDSAASELLGSARAAVAAVVARVERQAAEAVQELERTISGIEARVSDPAPNPAARDPGQAMLPAAPVHDPTPSPAGGSAPRIDPRPAQPTPKPAVLTPGGAWLPAPEPSPEPRSTPRDSQHGPRQERDEHTTRQELGTAGTNAVAVPAVEAAQPSATAGQPAGASGLAEAAGGCSQAVQGDGHLNAQPAPTQTPRDPVSWSGRRQDEGVATA